MKLGDIVNFVEFTDFIFPPNFCVQSRLGRVVNFDKKIIIIATIDNKLHFVAPDKVFDSVDDLIEWSLRAANELKAKETQYPLTGVNVKWEENWRVPAPTRIRQVFNLSTGLGYTAGTW